MFVLNHQKGIAQQNIKPEKFQLSLGVLTTDSIEQAIERALKLKQVIRDMMQQYQPYRNGKIC